MKGVKIVKGYDHHMVDGYEHSAVFTLKWRKSDDPPFATPYVTSFADKESAIAYARKNDIQDFQLISVIVTVYLTMDNEEGKII